MWKTRLFQKNQGETALENPVEKEEKAGWLSIFSTIRRFLAYLSTNYSTEIHSGMWKAFSVSFIRKKLKDSRFFDFSFQLLNGFL